MLVHHLYISWPPQQRGRVALLLGALAAMWTYDFNLYVIGYFAIERAHALYALRGPLMALLAPVIAVGMRRDMAAQVQLSRLLTFRALSLVSIPYRCVSAATAAGARHPCLTRSSQESSSHSPFESDGVVTARGVTRTCGCRW